ncbi:HAD family phosphatase [Herbiconiux sp. KACC 21604]|uniref:HAD family hydrolase n=1 Tax=unclassified Herbiconiux TaxID=2618217 RepID=UPI001490EBC2|nr:HAD family phosphatase [Herbiconiux sp. SALV-R1]QJU53514.1 HAD family phosphatase [Herbiconiux sp. SALV-R1]WPO88492.1 HAD family phosphatase [Herbiconiux sp. KACC 21604]
MNAPAPAAVLWDMDGTIVDTEPYWMRAEAALVESFGGTWTHEAAMTLVGSALDRSAAILQDFGVALPAGEIIDRLSSSVMEQVTIQVPWRPGAVELLEGLHALGVPQALVTMSIGRMARHVAARIPFDAFQVIVSADDVEQGKPHPEAYLTAADALGVDIARSVALEDSVTGVTSAVASGAVVVGVEHLLNLDDTGAHRIWQTLAGRTPDDLAVVLAEVAAERVSA